MYQNHRKLPPMKMSLISAADLTSLLHAAGFGAADDEVAAISLSGFSNCCPTARGGPVWTGGEGNWMGESMPLHAASYGHSTTLRCPRASAPELKHGAAA